MVPQVMVFSWSGCPFCKNAKGLLSDLGAAYTAVELDTLGDEGKAIRAELAQVGDGQWASVRDVVERGEHWHMREAELLAGRGAACTKCWF
jgi:hypothetical protein